MMVGAQITITRFAVQLKIVVTEKEIPNRKPIILMDQFNFEYLFSFRLLHLLRQLQRRIKKKAERVLNGVKVCNG